MHRPSINSYPPLAQMNALNGQCEQSAMQSRALRPVIKVMNLIRGAASVAATTPCNAKLDCRLS